MTEREKEYAKIIGRNLRRIAYEHDKTQAQIAKDLRQPTATVSSWMNGTRIPRMGKIDLLCEYFGVSRVDIMEPHNKSKLNTFELTNLESEIISGFRFLNDDGKEKIREYLADIIVNPKYTETGKKSPFSKIG